MENNSEMIRNCENCNWCHMDELEDMICVNGDSDYCSDYVDATHSCDEFEGEE